MGKFLRINPNDIVGKKIGNLIVLRYLGKRPAQKHLFKDWSKLRLDHTYKVKCKCGEESFVKRDKLIGKNLNTNCKYCYRKTHGFYRKTGTYYSWASMKENNKLKRIKICKKWNSFEGFLEDMGERPKYRVLMRKNLDKGYNKTNCRWGTKKEAMSNLKHVNLIKINRIKKSLRDWFFHFGFTEGQYNWYKTKKNKQPLREFFKLKDTDTITEHYKYQK